MAEADSIKTTVSLFSSAACSCLEFCPIFLNRMCSFFLVILAPKNLDKIWHKRLQFIERVFSSEILINTLHLSGKPIIQGGQVRTG